jgi:hypothetical protein
MTDVLDRLQSTPHPEVSTVVPRSRPFAVSGPARALLAALSAAAGVIHLVMVPSHMAESTIEGVGFAVAGWSQLVIAALVVIAPSRALLRATVVTNLAFIAAWVVSRTAGLPFGENAGHAESVGFLDLTCVGAEAALVLASCAVLARPGLGSSLRGPRLAVAAVVPVGILAVTSAAIASPGARNHAHDSHGDAAMAADHEGASASGDHHDTVGHEGAASTGALTDLNGHEIKGVKAEDVAHESEPDKPLDAATRGQLAAQLIAARETALKYPTVADAERAGYHLVGGGFGPGAGAHYIGFGGGAFGGFDAAKPPTLIYSGINPTSQIVGLMYLGGGENGRAPEGFVGPNDHWHRHSGVCLRGADVIFPVDASVTEAQCTSAGGSFMNITTWMVHAWVVPGWESPAGVFSHENPNLRCADGTFKTDEIGRCEGT